MCVPETDAPPKAENGIRPSELMSPWWKSGVIGPSAKVNIGLKPSEPSPSPLACTFCFRSTGKFWVTVCPKFERSEEHTSELQSQSNLVCRLLLEKKTHVPASRHCIACLPWH